MFNIKISNVNEKASSIIDNCSFLSKMKETGTVNKHKKNVAIHEAVSPA